MLFLRINPSIDQWPNLQSRNQTKKPASFPETRRIFDIPSLSEITSETTRTYFANY